MPVAVPEWPLKLRPSAVRRLRASTHRPLCWRLHDRVCRTGDFRGGDLEALPYSDDAFDVVTGFNSFQYAGNPIIALGEARRVTKADGKLVIMTWGDPAKMEAASLVTALRPLMPPPPPNAPGPFAFVSGTGAAQIYNRR